MEKMTPEFIGLLVLAAMQIANFWFHAAKHRRDEDSVKRAEMKEVEARLESKMAKLDAEIKAMEVKIERKSDVMREEIRADLGLAFEKVNHLSVELSAIKSVVEHLDQRMIRIESKLDNLKK